MTVLDQDHLFAVGQRRILERLQKSVVEAYPDSYAEGARAVGVREAKELKFSIEPIRADSDFDLFSFTNRV